MRILAWPAFEGTTNTYTPELYKAIKKTGCDVTDFNKRKFAKGAYQLWHVHWPESYPNKPSLVISIILSCALLTMAISCSIRGIPIIWTVHNIGSHDPYWPRLEKLVIGFFLRFVDGLIFLNEDSRRLLEARFPAASALPSRFIPHGHYREKYPPPYPGKQQAREDLGLPKHEPVVLFFGQIRPYKNVPGLAKAFLDASIPGASLLIAGAPIDEKMRQDIMSIAADKQQIHTKLELIPDDLVPILFAAADLVVLPYRKILNSGVALLALTFNRPVLVPATGSMNQLRNAVGPEWVHTYTNTFSHGVLERAMENVAKQQSESTCAMDRFSWPSIAKETTEFYETLA